MHFVDLSSDDGIKLGIYENNLFKLTKYNMKRIVNENQYHFKNQTSYFQDLKDLKNTNLTNININNDFTCSKKSSPRK